MQELTDIDTDTLVAGAETSRVRWADGCVNGTVMELWTIQGGGHIPFVWETEFTERILEWLEGVYWQALEVDTETELPEQSADVEAIEIGGDRPATLLLPADREGPLPLVLSLHGYGSDARGHDWYFRLGERVAQYGFALITPEGTVDADGNRFWNATDACCNFHGSDVDDVAYLQSLVDEARQSIDISRIFAVGYSNGGFMAYRLACDGFPGLTAIASLAGSSWGDEARCDAAPLVSVLQIHGDSDDSILYEGTLEYDSGYPGATEVLARWSERAGCLLDLIEELPRIDLDSWMSGDETTVQRVREGCSGGVTMELWRIEGAGHYPILADDFADRLLDWLLITSSGN